MKAEAAMTALATSIAMAFVVTRNAYLMGATVFVATPLWLVALYGVGGLIYTRVARLLLNRWGEPGLARIGGVCTALAFGTMALAPTWHFAPFACLVAGFGFYALHNTMQANATQMAPEARGTETIW